MKKYLISFIVLCALVGGAFIANASLNVQKQSGGLIGEWSLAEEDLKSATVIADKTPNGNDGTISAGASAGFVTDQKGQANRAYDFDGADTKIETSWTSNDDLVNGFTISAWIKANSGGESGESGGTNAGGRIVDKTANTSAGDGFLFGMGDNALDNRLYVRVNANVAANIVSADTIVYGIWIHALITITSAGTTNFYIDGVHSGATDQASNALSDVTTSNPLTIGNRSGTTDYSFDGSISDVRIYDRVLSQEEVEEYKSGEGDLKINALSEGLMGSWDLKEDDLITTTRLADLTTNANYGTIITGSGGFVTDHNGRPNGAYNINDTDSVRLANSNVLFPPENIFSVSVWAKGSGNLGDADYIFSGQRAAASSFIGLRGGGASGSASWVYANDAASVSVASGIKNIDDEEWHHYVFIRNEADICGYVDGVLDYSASNAGQDAAALPAYIGAVAGGGGNFFNGYISNFKVYNKELTIEEVNEIYTGGTAQITVNNLSKGLQAVQIGDQCWMSENMNAGTKIDDPGADAISTACAGYTDTPFEATIGGLTCNCTSETTASCQTNGEGSTTQKYCYSNDEANCTLEGGLYEWQEAMDLPANCAYTDCSASINTPHQGICPDGWHIPTDTEYKILEMNQGMSQAQADTTSWRGTTEGDKLKAGGLCQGRTPCATSHFDAPLAGYRNVTGAFGSRGSSADFWSSSQSSASYAWSRSLSISFPTVYRYAYGKYDGFSVRCLKD